PCSSGWRCWVRSLSLWLGPLVPRSKARASGALRSRWVGRLWAAGRGAASGRRFRASGRSGCGSSGGQGGRSLALTLVRAVEGGPHDGRVAAGRGAFSGRIWGAVGKLTVGAVMLAIVAWEALFG